MSKHTLSHHFLIVGIFLAVCISLTFYDAKNYVIAAQSAIDPDFSVTYDVTVDGSIDEPAQPEMRVYLTVDDGPTEHMERMLDILKEYGAVATFFMLEPHIREYPDVVLRAAQEGHALGSHGVTHKHHIFYKSTESMISEMDATIAAIREVIGVAGPLIRVPYGSSPNVSKKQKDVFAAHGYKLWDWNVDSYDWKLRDYRYVSTTIKQLAKLRDNDKREDAIVLLHDMKTTIDHLPSLLSYLRDSGYVFCILDPFMPEYQLGP